MGTPSEDFKQACNQGNVLPYTPPPDLASVFDSYKLLAQDLIDQVRSHFLAGKNTEICFGFSTAPNLNAYATMIGKRGVIVMGKGAVLVPLDSLQRMLSNPTTLTFIGDASVETMLGQFSEGIVNNIDRLHKARRLSGLPLPTKLPNDPCRAQFVRAANKIAFEFLVVHEIAHIVTGQLEFFDIAFGMDTILDAQSGRTTFLRAKTIRQAIELMADNMATGVTLSNFLAWEKDLLPQHWDRFFSTPEQRVYMWCFAVSVIFRLWGLQTDLTDLRDQDYPPPAMRFFATFGTIDLMLQNSKIAMPVSFRDIANKAFYDVDASIVAIGGLALRDEDFNLVYSDEGKEHFTRLRKCMGKLLNRFRPYSVVPMVGEYI